MSQHAAALADVAERRLRVGVESAAALVACEPVALAADTPAQRARSVPIGGRSFWTGPIAAEPLGHVEVTPAAPPARATVPATL